MKEIEKAIEILDKLSYAGWIPAEYVAEKYNIRGDADGQHRREDSSE